MEKDRKRRIDQLLGHLETKLDSKRRKLNRLQDELYHLESEGLLLQEAGFQSNAFEQSSPISGKKSSLLFSKNVQSPTLHDESSLLSIDTSVDSSFSPVVSLPLSPSRKSTRLHVSVPGVTPPHFQVSGRKEANILARVAHLQKEGKLVAGKKLAKLQPPPRPKTHWDFVIEEMVWLSGVFAQEIKMKKVASKKCARMVQKHFTDKALAVQRAERAHEQQLRRISSFMAKEVRGFWGNIEKLFEFKLKSQIERKRKIAMDEHLNFIVDRTEKYSTLLAESMAESASLKTTPTASDSEMGAHIDDDDYQPDQNSDDDEATIAKEEDDHEDDELDLLKAESDIPVEELLRLYHPELYGSPVKEAEPKQRRRDRGTNNLESSKKLSGKKMPSHEEEKKSTAEENDDQEEDAGDDADEESDAEDDNDDENQGEEEESSGLEALVTGSDEKFSDVIEMAAKFQPTGNTLDTTSVRTKIPFLLKGTLREYQHIGLDWLFSLHERKLNGILADEMGLGKTIQTISLLLHLACEKHVWGPHLIVVPTSVMLNWEMELKKWAPAFKVLTYYGSQKERRLKRVGWTKPNAFHVCITSYKLVIQDHQAFRRKRWVYLILDEAQHIKNFKSQRWQLLLNFVSEGRLLLTGTPLQNNLMELWSLMHFLMPNVFESHRDFKEWFSNPLTGMVEGSAEYNESLIQRLHKVLRPFLLRRLKSEVEKQMPKKYEHIVKCPLSKRQRYLYDDFMSRAKTRETLEGGNLLSVINVLMQLRKVCNHPNLFEPRATIAPFVADAIKISFPNLVSRALDHNPFNKIDLSFHPLVLSSHEFHLTAYAFYKMGHLKMCEKQFDNCVTRGLWRQTYECPKGKLRLHIGTGPVPPMPKTDIKIPLQTVINNNLYLKRTQDITIRTPKGLYILTPRPTVYGSPEKKMAPVTGCLSPSENEAIDLQEDEIRAVEMSGINSSESAETKKKNDNAKQVDKRLLRGIFSSSIFSQRSSSEGGTSVTKKSNQIKAIPPKLRLLPQLKTKLEETKKAHVQVLSRINEKRCSACPLYGLDLIGKLSVLNHSSLSNGLRRFTPLPVLPSFGERTVYSTSYLAATKQDLVERLSGFASRFQLFVTPCVVHPTNSGLDPNFLDDLTTKCESLIWNPVSLWTSKLASHHLLQLPETRLIQYDCGKLQVLGRLLQQLKEGGHRVLLFTQMTKVLDVLESFMNFQGHTYLRLDGSTKIEQRQILMERFNANSKYFCFILSTRSGGVGVNLTGADTVIFYDSDWNPTMDAQAQDRCHRIGQTRDVHIYRLVSERSVEENILKKANQKRLLGDIAIEGGNFTTAHFKKSTIRDLFEVTEETTLEDETVVVEMSEAVNSVDASNGDGVVKKKINIFESALAAVEENTDVEALNLANQEAEAEEAEFNEDQEKEDDRFGHLMKQLSAVERYALSQVEFYEGDWKREQLAAADAQIEAQRKDFDARKLQDAAENVVGASSVANSTTDDEDESEGEGDKLASPRTRSRGEVVINLWKLDKNKHPELKKF